MLEAKRNGLALPEDQRLKLAELKKELQKVSAEFMVSTNYLRCEYVDTEGFLLEEKL